MRPIDADAALKALRKCQTYLYDARDPELKIELSSAEAAINNLPSIQPERKKGEWIDYTEDGYVECPFCHSATNCDGNKDELHFCFSCGADMRGERKK